MEDEETLRIVVGIVLAVGAIMTFVFWIYVLRFFTALLKAVIHASSSHTIIDNQGISRSGANYSHPCVGQCKDQSVVLNKSPTPMYKHNCRAPCASATRSGKYYKGKQRKL